MSAEKAISAMRRDLRDVLIRHRARIACYRAKFRADEEFARLTKNGHRACPDADDAWMDAFLASLRRDGYRLTRPEPAGLRELLLAVFGLLAAAEAAWLLLLASRP